MSIFQTVENYEEDENKSSQQMSSAILVIVILWLLAGIAAFIWSLVCFGRSGTMAQKIIGLLLSMFLGPFYWIYFYVSKDYCRSQ